MLFNPRVVGNAMDRQSKMDKWGSWCATCGKLLLPLRYEAVPRKPISRGGDKKVANCVVVCPNCFSKLKKPGVEEIADNQIPYYRTSPPQWYS